MSVLIKGVEMPKYCQDCPCYNAEYCECNAIVGLWVNGRKTPPSDCPLIPVPEHGRLIDADAIDTSYSDPEVVETLNDAPTIIPADKEEQSGHHN